jgi:triphosphoribosyl-dephospho-CoA synthetase
LANGHSFNEALCRSLLAIMAATPDTNLIHRGGMEAQNWVWEILKTDPDPADLCPEFEKRNLSPGGSADLLAVSYFLHFLTA